ncbi:hypothetical protein PFISCL1PPCAC_15325, partial [Pristionchus fissidentatus]
AAPSPIPSGLEDLSEEERMKIMSVMACAEWDAQSGLIPTSPSLTQPPIVAPSIEPHDLHLIPSTSDTRKDVVHSPMPVDMDLSGLSEAEREQILSVMQMAENMEGEIPSIISPYDQRVESAPSSSFIEPSIRDEKSREEFREDNELQPEVYGEQKW